MAGVNSQIYRQDIYTRYIDSLFYSTQAADEEKLAKEKSHWYKIFWFILFHSLPTCLYFLNPGPTCPMDPVEDLLCIKRHRC